MIQHIPLNLRSRYVFCTAPINKKQPFVCTSFLKVSISRHGKNTYITDSLIVTAVTGFIGFIQRWWIEKPNDFSTCSGLQCCCLTLWLYHTNKTRLCHNLIIGLNRQPLIFRVKFFYYWRVQSFACCLYLQLCCTDSNSVPLSVCPSVQSRRTSDIWLGLSPCQLASGSTQKHKRPGSLGGCSWCVRSLPLVKVITLFTCPANEMFLGQLLSPTSS